mmetsp:Transcript_42211/g.62510  ORF Transcript_42211/g.62510 Transcript_42211/m.62510 type:complete len:83 (+) Transcript_42211:199-447(+)
MPQLFPIKSVHVLVAEPLNQVSTPMYAWIGPSGIMSVTVSQATDEIEREADFAKYVLTRARLRQSEGYWLRLQKVRKECPNP